MRYDAELSRREAMQHFADALPDFGIRSVVSDHDPVDDLVWWNCVVFDPYAEDGEDVVGHAQFMEHNPVVEMHWDASTGNWDDRA